MVVASENSVHKLLELLPGKILNGDKVEVRLATRQNLSQFEAQARKRELRRRHVGGWLGGSSVLCSSSRGPRRSPAKLSGRTPRVLGVGGNAARSLWGFFPIAAESD